MLTTPAFKKIAALCFGALVVAAGPAQAQASDYPSRPIRIIVGFAPGGSADTFGRYYALRLSEELKTPVVIDNKPGAGQVLAVRTLTAAPPDGYTLYLGTGSAFSQGPGVRTDLPFDPLKDFTLVGMVALAPGVIVVSPNVPAGSVAEFVEHAKANPNKLNYGSSGIGSASHLQSEYFTSLTGTKMTHIPFKGDAEIMRAISEGSVQMGISTIQGAMTAVAGGRVKALAVTGSRRLKSFPNVPALAESGIKGLEGIDPYTYYGLVGPVNMPPAVVAKLNTALSKVNASKEAATHVQERLYAEPGSGSADAFRKFIETDTTKWRAFSKTVKLID